MVISPSGSPIKHQTLKDIITEYLPIIVLCLLGIIYIFFINDKKDQVGVINCPIGYIKQGSECKEIKLVNNTSSGTNLDVNTPTGEIKTEYDLFRDIVKKGNNVTFTPPNQPFVKDNNCSSIMNSYIRENNFLFTTPNSFNTGYLYIRFKEYGNTVPQPPVFLYFHNTNQDGFPVSGYPNGDNSIETPTKGEYLFNINNIPLVRFYDKQLKSFERSQYFNGSEQYIGGYVRACNGSQIETIIIAWD